MFIADGLPDDIALPNITWLHIFRIILVSD